MGKGDITRRNFVAAYFANGLNATQAYLAIKPNVKQTTAEVEGCKLLRNPKVAALVAEHEKTMREKFKIDEEQVLREAARIAFFDIRKLFRSDGTLKLPQEWDDDTAAAVAGFDFASSDNGAQISKVRLADKNSAVDKLMRYHGLFNKEKSRDKLPTIINRINLGGPNGGRLRPEKDK